MKYLVLFILFTSFSTTSLATDPNQARKLALADEYFGLVSMKDMWDGMVTEMVKQMPEEQKNVFLNIMNNYVNLNLLENTAKESLLRHLNEKELETYVRFMKDPNGKSATDKMKYYMADIMPIIQNEVKRAISEYQIEEEEKEKLNTTL